MGSNILEMMRISKSFPGVQALDKVDFSCHRGECHGLVGENGAGKSTLMKILSGVYRPDEGEISLRGKTESFSHPRDAQECGISTIYQEFNLVPEMNVAENIVLGREPIKNKRFFIDTSLRHSQAKQLLSRLGTNIDPRIKVKDLSVAQQQMVEVAKALYLNAEIIIMDEPSAVVSGKELDSLFRTIQSLKGSGKTIIYISHRIEEIFQITDRVTVLKDGKLIGTIRTQDADKSTLIRMMVGRTLSDVFPPKEQGKREEILTLKNISRDKTIRNISLSVYTGEILGVAGLVGSGRTELARAIYGADPIEKGKIYFKGKEMKARNPKTSLLSGLGFLTEDRKREGIFHSMSVSNNLTSLVLDKINSAFFINKERERKTAKSLVEQFNIITPSLEQKIHYLSGGNQQKTILAKWINLNPKLIIMDEPTRGIDVGAKAEIYNLMRELVKKGTSIIMISSELPEIIGMSDRIVVMHEGRIVGELSSEEATEERILMMATGQTREQKEGESSIES